MARISQSIDYAISPQFVLSAALSLVLGYALDALRYPRRSSNPP